MVDSSQLIKTHSVTGYSKTCTVFLVKDHTRFFEAMYGIHTHVKKHIRVSQFGITAAV